MNCRRLWTILLACNVILTARAQPTFSGPFNFGPVSYTAIKQASGVVASRNNGGVLWTHNDSGDTPRIFALDTNGNHLATFNLTNASAIDYEDIAIGPGPVTNVQYLYVGDIGDNNSVRSNIVVYRVPEPAVYLRWATNAQTLDLQGVNPLTFLYPDAPHNAEALMIDPISGDLFIIAKQPASSAVYTATKAELAAGGTNTLHYVRNIFFDVPNGADISPNGSEIIIRQENFAQLWMRAPGDTVSNALGGTPISIPVVGRPTEPNGEAIGFDALGSGYFTLSDSTTNQPLYYFARTSPIAVQEPRALVGEGSTWRYLDTGANLGTAWRTNGFNDSTWKTGDGQFGYGDGDEETIVSYGSSKKNKFVTTYFRKKFVVTNLADIVRLDLKLVFDDGAAVFLNGTQIVLANLTNNAAYNSLATNTQTDLQSTWLTFPVSPALLTSGTNLLAVEVHQAATNSPDLSFDAQLVAYDKFAPQFFSTTSSPDGSFAFMILALGTSVTVEASTNLPIWKPLGTVPLNNGVGSFTDPADANRPRRFYRLSQ